MERPDLGAAAGARGGATPPTGPVASTDDRRDAGGARRLHLLLDGYGYDGDRVAFGVTVARRARINAEAINGMAAAGDPIGVALMPWVDSLQASAGEVENLPASFWTHPQPA